MVTLAVSDIGGRLEYLEAAFSVEDVDDYVFLGDYIDNGPNSKEVLESIIDIYNPKYTTFLLGDRDYLAIHAVLHGQYRDYWLSTGGQQTLDSYNGDYALLEKHLLKLVLISQGWHLRHGLLFAHKRKPMLSDWYNASVVSAIFPEENRTLWEGPAVLGHEVVDRPFFDKESKTFFINCGSKMLGLMKINWADYKTTGVISMEA